MLNGDKIKIMTKLAIYEQGNGKKDIKISHFYKSDYIRYNILKTIVATTVGILMLMGFVGLYHIEYFISNITEINYRHLATLLLFLYLSVIAGYVILTIVITPIKYKEARKNLIKYNRQLKELNAIYKAEKNDIK